MKRWEIYVYAAAIVLLNIPLAFGGLFEELIFTSTSNWLQIITHPFIHVSWYHLVLDASAFLVLYSQIAEPSRFRRTVYVVVCGLSSLLAAVIVLPKINSVGYCGLSGIGHGLMCICAMEMIFCTSAEKTNRMTGIILLLLLAAKCSLEAATGKMFFDFMHSGLIGSPIAVAHAGGLIGGSLIFIIFNFERLKATAQLFAGEYQAAGRLGAK
ncbi:MAG: rhombosortase [Planctomycetes bacterium GWF2_41_51]|nr:MAG: rhombosortase [Planctomycetes bacterium GWF2_41_51]